ncbi:uncharacterized protein LOC117167949 isoform X2 [Belonocnema kinseyi]|uniref:uncharacterized protein LOC117167949 isoform X2 n=1 Tax=Belonocnema kinseyi TaxID=2817044 RepID=UPI00143DC3CA|nr:uncharacterized protein LOC117167949 isoform X2 [Belonocnema kinseyi]
MRIVWTLFLSLPIILNSIEFGSQSNFSPGDEAGPSSPRQEPVASPPERSPRRSLRHARRQSSAVSLPSADPDLRARSRSPGDRRLNFRKVLGFKIEDLRLIRLQPRKYPSLIFELRNYNFPLDTPIRLRKQGQGFHPVPTRAQIVLSAPDGDVFAIVERNWSNNTILRAMYKLDNSPAGSKRAKINMYSEEVKELDNRETLACPINAQSIRSFFDVYRVSRNFLNQ